MKVLNWVATWFLARANHGKVRWKTLATSSQTVNQSKHHNFQNLHFETSTIYQVLHSPTQNELPNPNCHFCP
jgi:hypothetical protein